MEQYYILSIGKLGGKLYTMPHPPGGSQLPDAVSILQNRGINAVLSLLSNAEAEQLQLAKEGECFSKANIDFFRFPIEDYHPPVDFLEVYALCKILLQRISAGEKMIIHCRAGIGRSSLMAACLLIVNGKKTSEAYEIIAEARGMSVPETAAQLSWTKDFEHFVKNLNPNPDLKC